MKAVSSTFGFVRRALPWALLFAGVFWMSNVVKPSGVFHVGEHLPSFSAELLDGGRFVLPEKPGRPLIVNFWATYCAPCRDEAPLLAAAARGGAQVIGLAVDTRLSAGQVSQAAAQLGMTYPIGVGDNALVKQFQVTTVPTTYVLALDGKIVLSRVGRIGASELDAALALARK